MRTTSLILVAVFLSFSINLYAEDKGEIDKGKASVKGDAQASKTKEVRTLDKPSGPEIRTLGGETEEEKTLAVEGSKILSSVYSIKPMTPSSRFVDAVIALENAAQGIDKAHGQVATDKDKEVQNIISGVMDLEVLGQRAMVRYWDDLAKTKKGIKMRSQYIKLFKELVEANYLDKIRVYVSGKYQIPLMTELGTKKGAVVEARIKKSDVDLVVEFHFLKKKDEWRIFDVKLDETSLESTYRSSFNRIIRKKGGLDAGFPELLDVMKQRLTELQKGTATKL